MINFFRKKRSNLIFNKSYKKYLFYATGEIVLVVIGILIALQINNWNELKKEKAVEVKTLREISDAIGSDLYDINENIIGFSYRINAYKVLLEHIEDNSPWDDELRESINQIKGITTFISNIGPYETLKSRGLTTITNDTLRLKIASYYDIEYDKLYTKESSYHEHFTNYIKPSIMEFFYIENVLEPIDYVKLLKDFRFKQIITWALNTETYMLNTYDQIRIKASDLSDLVDKEIIKLES